jgi:adenylate kinase
VDCVGRKTILEEVCVRLNGSGLVPVFRSFSEIMKNKLGHMEKTKRIGINRLYSLSTELRRQLQSLAAADLINETGDGIFRVISGQCVVDTGGYFVSGFDNPDSLLDLIGIKTIIMLMDEPSRIIERRKRQSKEPRWPDWVNHSAVGRLQDIELSVSSQLALRTGRSFVVVDRHIEGQTPEGEVDEAANNIVMTLKKLGLVNDAK